MASPTVSIRCPACGTQISVAPAPSPPTQWVPCPHCAAPVPIVVPRDLPPLYSWEVLPGLYPALPIPRPRRWRARPIVAIALALIAFTAAMIAGLLIYEGVRATAPATYVVAGEVVREESGAWVAVTGARVVLTDQGPTNSTAFTGTEGTFSFSGVPSGGFSLNITFGGYAPVEVLSFVSPVYDAGSQGLVVGLTPGGLANGTNVTLSPFPDLETFVAYVGGEAALLFLISAVCAVAVVLTVRENRPAVGVVAGAAGVAAPVTLLFLSLGTIFPVATAGAAIAGGLGAFVLALRASEIALVDGAVAAV
jgi:hypothetical protein